MYLFFYTRGYWRCRQYLGDLHTYLYVHTGRYWRCRQYPGGRLYVFFISYPRVLAVPPIPWRAFIRISYFIPEGIGGAANTLVGLYTYFLFHTRGYWRCRQYPGGHLYVFLISYPRVLAVPPIPWGPISYVSLLSNMRVLAVPPISRDPSNVYVFSYSTGIGGAANTREAPHAYVYFQTRGYWGYRQYPGGPHTYLYFHTLRVLAVPPVSRGPSYYFVVAYSSLSRNDHKP